MQHITSELRTEISVGRAGFARYSDDECRRKAEQEWYRRGYDAPLSLRLGTKALFILKSLWRKHSNGL